MARHMRNGRDYSRPGPKVDYELRKDSNNAARSGDVYDKFEEVNTRLTQLIRKKTITVNITNGVDYVQTGLTENDIPVSVEMVGYTTGAMLRVDFGFISSGNKILLKFNNTSGSAMGNKSVNLYYINNH